MQIDPLKNKKTFIWKQYPDLRRRRIFSIIPIDYSDFRERDLDKMIRFCILFVDPESPFVSESNFSERAKMCLDKLGYDEDEDFYKYHFKDSSEYWQEMMFSYFKMVNDHLYELWFSTKIGVHNLQKQMRNPFFDSERMRKTLKDVQDFTKQLISIEDTLFPDSKTRNLVSRLATEDKLSGYAEKFAIDPNNL